MKWFFELLFSGLIAMPAAIAAYTCGWIVVGWRVGREFFNICHARKQ